MSTIAARLRRMEERREADRDTAITMYDGPPMTPDEVDTYNRTRRPDQPIIITLRIDRAHEPAIELSQERRA